MTAVTSRGTLRPVPHRSVSISRLTDVTLAQARVCSAVAYSPQRHRVVTTARDDRSMGDNHDLLATRMGAEIVVVPSDDGRRIDQGRLRAAPLHTRDDELETAVTAIDEALETGAWRAFERRCPTVTGFRGAGGSV